MKKKLTYRQQQFFKKFQGIYLETNHSVHYAMVAERLGIGKVTAYEMLRLLEEHGLVGAEYQTNPDQHGPGRSAVLFYPTEAAGRAINHPAGDYITLEDWKTTKDQILKKLREGQAGEYEGLLSDIVERIPELRSPLIFATELITMVLLMLATVRDAPEIRAMIERLRRIGLPKEIGLSVISGISMLLSVLERTNRYYSKILLTQIKRYEESLAQLGEEGRLLLGEYTREVVNILAI